MNDNERLKYLKADDDLPPATEMAFIASPAKDFGDTEALLNSRTWLESALSGKGARITGGGIGCGGADVDINLDGFNFVVSIKPM
ncbi:MAG: hypothetical protein PHQ40_21610 [Anaerolineaceae bacterium]|nr:hypothetical protein [Anaerolineaceae bacterium]